MNEYTPLGVRRGAIDPDVLHEGVPPWLTQSLRDWVKESLQVQQARGGGWVTSDEGLRAIERVCRISLDWQYGTASALRELLEMAGSDSQQQERFLWAVDYLCSLPWPSQVDSLDRMLKEAGSAWRVSKEGVPHLERRVSEGVAEAAEKVMSASGEAGKLLAEAWRELYGMKPDQSEAYRHAVRAIEAAAHETVIPDNPKATLGTMIAAMRDKPTKWRVTTDGTHPVETLIGMMETVWTGQIDRHGEKGGVPDLVEGAAEVAVHVAAALVGMFSSGAIERVDNTL